MEGVNPIEVHCKHICKCHNEHPPQQLIYANKMEKKSTGGIAQVVKHLPSMYEALGSILSTTKKKKQVSYSYNTLHNKRRKIPNEKCKFTF
jgi:hypothetical protein